MRSRIILHDGRSGKCRFCWQRRKVKSRFDNAGNGGFLRSPPALIADVSYFSRYEGNIILGNTDTGDGVKFRGRGFKQLTGRYNYSEYWLFRGWIGRKDYDHSWFSRKTQGSHGAGPKIDHPEIIGNDAYSCVDTAGFFCARYGIAKVADRGLNEAASRAVTSIVNHNDKQSPPLRWTETKEAIGYLENDLRFYMMIFILSVFMGPAKASVAIESCDRDMRLSSLSEE